MNNKQIPLASNQISGFKRAIQIFKKSVALHLGQSDHPFVNLKLNDLQNEVAKSIHFGSFNEILSLSKRLDSPIHVDCHSIENEIWSNTRESITSYFEKKFNLKGISLLVANINWYPLPDEELTSESWISDLIVKAGGDKVAKVNLKSPEGIAISYKDFPHTYKDSQCVHLKHYDLRHMYSFIKKVASENEIPWISINDGCYILGTCAIFLAEIPSPNVFHIIQMGHHNNKTLLPLLACDNVNNQDCILFRESEGYVDTYLGYSLVNSIGMISNNQAKSLTLNSLFPTSQSHMLVSA